ncbi:MAG: C4-type zinc ribbon domain-containing protein [Desulfobacterales bacterium]
MKDQINILVNLQKIETESDSIKLKLSDVSKRLETLDEGLKEFERTIEDQESIINELKKRYRDYESDSQINLELEKKSQEKLRSVKTNREYQSILKEIEDIKAKNSKIEDEMIECLDQMDEKEKFIATKKDEYLQLADSIKNDKLTINQEVGQGKKKLDELEAERKGVSSMAEPELLKKYFIVKEQNHGGLAVVPVKDAVCRGCNVNLPPQLYNELHSYETLKFCPNCHRIIYLKGS